MLVETVVTLSAILGLLLSATVFVFHVLTRKREQHDSLEFAADTVDKASDAAILEINKTAQLALEELDEKYQKLLFLYQLMDDKQSVLENTAAQAAPPVSLAAAPLQAAPLHAAPPAAVEPLTAAAVESATPAESAALAEPESAYAPPPKYAQIKELQEQGLTIKEIAKQLGLGKGEVEMVINLALQSSKQAVL